MNTYFLTHFYFGDRQKTYLTGLGTIIRAIGQSKEVSIIVINNSFSWLEKLENTINNKFFFLDLNDEKIDIKAQFISCICEISNQICLIVNFDLLIEMGYIKLQTFLELIKKRKTINEFILTSEKRYPEIEKIADYVSFISSK